jgi:hypothetical protein
MNDPDEGYSRKEKCVLNSISAFLFLIHTHKKREKKENKKRKQQQEYTHNGEYASPQRR